MSLLAYIFTVIQNKTCIAKNNTGFNFLIQPQTNLQIFGKILPLV
ncbi:hypothetical protein QJU08_09755 [Pasteurella atlantica]|nr:hypothetical protein [Pasteurella atlantica]MDP8048864.1 hypothetical protein [Pasteurella atlantica]MDP8058660.1 hypothetical protein [Pasteurella atlantica]MDP8074394.1 hypothetical protein [Pasteurella atlantica]MDP8092387.1 hypothetical protein [Pasteurella atlantica]MDP8113828.1 hypothetical protein [Pasteurella atlantica]